MAWTSPRSVASTATTINVNGLPLWVPAPGKYADITSTLATTVDPCPSATCIYSGFHPSYPHSFHAKWNAWGGGVFATALGGAGSMLFYTGGHDSYDGNDVTRFDVETRTWSQMSLPSLYGQGKTPGWPATGDSTNAVVGPFGMYPDGTAYPFHTNMGVCYLPSDAGGGSLGSFVFMSHGQTGVACDNDCRLWRFDLAVAMANLTTYPCPAWSYGPTNISIQNFSFGNGSAQRGALAYDSKRKGVWVMRYHGSGNLSFFSFLTNTETQVTKTGDASWNVTGQDTIPLTYHAGKDCLISRDSFNNLCVADLSNFNIAAPTGIPSKFHTPANPPTAYGPDVAVPTDVLEYCPHDQNCYLLDWYVKTEARLYKLSTPANVITGPWQWSYEILGKQTGLETLELRPEYSTKSLMGRFRYVPAYKSFMWSDDSILKPQIGRPLAFT
jgi:hypothetical protein